MLPRKRRAPCRLDDGIEPPGFPATATVEDHFHFLGAIDTAIGGLKDQFEQLGYATYSHLEQLLIKACQGNNFSQTSISVLNLIRIPKELIFNLSSSALTLISFDTASRSLAKKKLQKVTILDIQDYTCSSTDRQQCLLGEVCKIVQLILVMSATNCLSEHSFDALHRVKTYHKSTIVQERLNHLLVLHVHKGSTGVLDFINNGDRLVAGSQLCLTTFGKFN